MRVTNYCKKTLVTAACALTLVASGAVWAGHPGDVKIIFDGVVKIANGSLAAARFSQDANQYIACQVSASEANDTLEMACQAQDALGNTFVCSSDEWAHVAAVLAMSANSVVTVDNDHPEEDHCGNLMIGPQWSNLSPVMQ